MKDRKEIPIKTNNITFEDLDNININNNSSSSTHIENNLINENIHQENFFEKIIFDKYKREITDKEELKSEYLIWHKETLKSLLVENSFFFQKKNFKKAFNIMNIHPYLTMRDKRNIELIRTKIKDKYQRLLFFNSGFTFMLILFLLRRNNRNIETRIIIKTNMVRILMYIMISFASFNIFFNHYYKINFLNEYFQQENLTQKLIKEYI